MTNSQHLSTVWMIFIVHIKGLIKKVVHNVIHRSSLISINYFLLENLPVNKLLGIALNQQNKFLGVRDGIALQHI